MDSPTPTQLKCWDDLCFDSDEWAPNLGANNLDFLLRMRSVDPRVCWIIEAGYRETRRPISTPMLAAVRDLGYPLPLTLWDYADDAFAQMTTEDAQFFLDHVVMEPIHQQNYLLFFLNDARTESDVFFFLAEGLIRARRVPVDCDELWQYVLMVCAECQSDRMATAAIEAGNPPPRPDDTNLWDVGTIESNAPGWRLFHTKLCVERFGVLLTANIWRHLYEEITGCSFPVYRPPGEEDPGMDLFEDVANDPDSNPNIPTRCMYVRPLAPENRRANRQFLLYLIDRGCPPPTGNQMSERLGVRGLAAMWKYHSSTEAERAETQMIADYLSLGAWTK